MPSKSCFRRWWWRRWRWWWYWEFLMLGAKKLYAAPLPRNDSTYHTIQYHTIPYHTIPYHTIPYRTIPYHTILYHTIPYHTIPYLTPGEQQALLGENRFASVMCPSYYSRLPGVNWNISAISGVFGVADSQVRNHEKISWVPSGCLRLLFGAPDVVMHPSRRFPLNFADHGCLWRALAARSWSLHYKLGIVVSLCVPQISITAAPQSRGVDLCREPEVN